MSRLSNLASTVGAATVMIINQRNAEAPRGGDSTTKTKGGTVKSYAELMKEKRITEVAVGCQKKRQQSDAGGRMKKMKGASAQAEDGDEAKRRISQSGRLARPGTAPTSPTKKRNAPAAVAAPKAAAAIPKPGEPMPGTEKAVTAVPQKVQVKSFAELMAEKKAKKAAEAKVAKVALAATAAAAAAAAVPTKRALALAKEAPVPVKKVAAKKAPPIRKASAPVKKVAAAVPTAANKTLAPVKKPPALIKKAVVAAAPAAAAAAPSVRRGTPSAAKAVAPSKKASAAAKPITAGAKSKSAAADANAAKPMPRLASRRGSAKALPASKPSLTVTAAAAATAATTAKPASRPRSRRGSAKTGHAPAREPEPAVVDNPDKWLDELDDAGEMIGDDDFEAATATDDLDELEELDDDLVGGGPDADLEDDEYDLEDLDDLLN